jgi:hypothetical protein
MGSQFLAHPPYHELQLPRKSNHRRQAQISQLHIKSKVCLTLWKMPQKHSQKLQKTTTHNEAYEESRYVLQIRI